MRVPLRWLRGRRITRRRRRVIDQTRPPLLARAAPPVERRILAAGILIGLGLLLIIGRFFQLQVLRHAHYSELASVQQERRFTVGAVRGPIVDREGRVLVRTLTGRTLVARPSRVEDPAATARALAPILDRPEVGLARLLAGKARLVELDPQVDAGEASELRALGLPGIQIEEAGRRVMLADLDLVGSLNHEGRGDEGIECSMEEFLRGVDGWETRYTDASGTLTPRPGAPAKPAVHGSCVVLTVDAEIQWKIDDALARAVAAHRARGASAVLVDVHTGEVLALSAASNRKPGPGRRVNRLSAIEDAYEPGSTFKLVTFVAALEQGQIDDNSVFFAENGRANFGSCEIRDVKKMGWLCAADVLAQSSNIDAAKIGLMVGERGLYATARRLGFGSRTHIELPGEVGGILRPLSEWSGRSLPTVAIGQEVAVTNLQLAMAYATVANGGKLLRPRLVREVIGSDGRIRHRTEPEVVRRVMSRQTAATLTRYLIRAVEHGTARRAAVPGVPVAAKTGTAQKARRDGRGYDPDKYVSALAGFFPADAPRFALAVTIDEPSGAHYGGEVAAPVFREIAAAVLGPGHHLEGLRTVDGAPPPPAQVVVPDVRLMTREAALATLAAAGLEAAVATGGERVLVQEPPAGALVPPRAIVSLRRAPADVATMPDIRGLSLRQALRELRSIGAVPHVEGIGWVTRQEPEAGTPVASGFTCALELDSGDSEWRSLPPAPGDRRARSSRLALASTGGPGVDR